VLIRFNIELSDSQYKAYYNQNLMWLEQFAKPNLYVNIPYYQ